jgi:cytochrome d ubiquinol oxidase subunit II
LAAHGATYLILKTEGPVHGRSRALAKLLWGAAAPLFLAITIESWLVRPDVPGRAIGNPFCWFGILVVVASILALVSGLATGRERRAFAASTFLLIGILATGAAAIFPEMLHSTLAPENSLTAYDVASSPTALWLASIWWPVALALTTGYFAFVSWHFAGKVGLERDDQGVY